MRHHRPHRAAAALGGALTLLMTWLIAAGPVGATQPSRFLSIGTGFTEIESGSCPFDVQLVTTVGREMETDFAPGPDGTIRIHFTGTFKVELTNLASGRLLDLNISGPGQAVSYPDGSTSFTAEGVALAVHEGGIEYVQGRFDSATGRTVGRVTDVCAVLAG